MEDAIIDNLNRMLSNWNEYFLKMWNLLTTSPKQFKNTGGGNSFLWMLTEYAYDTLTGIGVGLLVLFFLIGVVKTSSTYTEVKRPEIIAKLFVRFALAKLAITNGKELLVNLIDFTQAVIGTSLREVTDRAMHYAGATSPTELTLPGEVVSAVHDGLGFWNSIGLWLLTFIGGLLVIALSFIMLLTIYGRFFKIYMYIAMSPLMMSTFAGEPTQNVGKGFLKNFIAVCMEGLVILLAFAIFTVYSSLAPVTFDASASPSTIVWGYLIELVLNLLVLVGSVKMCDRIVKEMMGQ